MREPKYVLASKLREEGMSYPEIAERLRVKVDDAHAYIYYANTKRKKLRRDKRYQQEQHKRRMARLREALGGRCKICGSTSSLEIHHVKPLLKSGNRLGTWGDTSNLQLLCHFCHDFIGSEWYYGTFREFRKRQKENLKYVEKSCHYFNEEAARSRAPRWRKYLLKKATHYASEAQEIKAWLARMRRIKKL